MPNANKILIVDDDQTIRWTLREALQSWGFASVEAGSVAEAVKHLNADLPTAVLLDIDLPDGSGLDVLRDHGLIISQSRTDLEIRKLGGIILRRE